MVGEQGRTIAAFYQNQSGCPVHGVTHIVNITEPQPLHSGIDEKDMLEIYIDVKRNNPRINPDLFTFTRSNLINAIEKVYPGLKYSDPDFDIVMKLRQNVTRFAGYKTAWQVSELKDVDDADSINTINKKYNTNWMRTEYVHTVRSTRAAKNWQNYVADSDLYPYLEYMPSTAAEPRNQHKLLYGVIKPLNDPFWDTWMPPADWGCQCSVQQRRTDKGANQPPDDITLPPATMRNNPGKEGVIFGDQHPMLKDVSKKVKKEIDDELFKLARKISRDEALQFAKNNIIGKTLKTKDGHILEVSTRSINKMNSQGSEEFIKFLPDIIGEMEVSKPPEKPSIERRNIEWSHFYQYQYKNLIFDAVLWQMKGENKQWLLHAFSVKNKP